MPRRGLFFKISTIWRIWKFKEFSYETIKFPAYFGDEVFSFRWPEKPRKSQNNQKFAICFAFVFYDFLAIFKNISVDYIFYSA